MKRVLFWLGIGAIVAGATQLVWFDKELTFSTATGGRICGGFLGPSNLKSPEDYTQENVYFAVKVISKPTDLWMGLQVCNWEGCETCSFFDWFNFTKAGEVKTIKMARLPAWWTNGCLHDWAKGSNAGCWVLKNAFNQWVDVAQAGWTMGPTAAQHLPVKVHLWAILITKGQKITMPSSWTGPCPADWPCEATEAKLSARALQQSAGLTLLGPTADGLVEVRASEDGILRLCTPQGSVVTVDMVAGSRRVISIANHAKGAFIATWDNGRAYVSRRLIAVY